MEMVRLSALLQSFLLPPTSILPRAEALGYRQAPDRMLNFSTARAVNSCGLVRTPFALCLRENRAFHSARYARCREFPRLGIRISSESAIVVLVYA